MIADDTILFKLPYFICMGLFCISIYGLITSKSRLKTMLCLGTLQTSAIIFFMSLSKVANYQLPFVSPNNSSNIDFMANPLPHVLMLTAIVVGVATLAVGLSLIIKIEKK